MGRELSVSEVNRHIKSIITGDFILNNLQVKGEISNCKYHDNGHIYFTLKDKSSAIKAVLWKNTPKPDFFLEDGMEVIVYGGVSLYEAGGYYQINVRQITKSGLGALYLKLEQLKDEYSKMGYFSEQYKSPIPPFARRIGIVTALTGAAIQDIIRVSKEKNPYVELIQYPALVQGAGAAKSIARGINILDSLGLDVIIVGRGGGSIEDLWAFNEEEVITAIFRARTPIISAVGHESDVTISDFVADRRAATPTDAARIAVCDLNDILGMAQDYRQKLFLYMERRINEIKARLKQKELLLVNVSPLNKLNMKKTELNEKNKRLLPLLLQFIARDRSRLENRHMILTTYMHGRLENQRSSLKILAGKLEALSPLKSLSRGFGYIEDENGKKVNSIDELHKNDMISIYLSDGYAKAQIKEKEHGGDGYFRE